MSSFSPPKMSTILAHTKMMSTILAPKNDEHNFSPKNDEHNFSQKKWWAQF